MVVFFDRGGDGVERHNISLTDMQGLMTSRWGLKSEVDQWTALRQVIAQCNPRSIGVNTSDVIWAADGLTLSLYNKLKDTLGAELSSRITSAVAAGDSLAGDAHG